MAKHDPLEDAKIGTKKKSKSKGSGWFGKKPKEPAEEVSEEVEFAPEPEEVSPEPEEALSVPEGASAAPPEEAAPEVEESLGEVSKAVKPAKVKGISVGPRPPSLKRYRVKNTCRISIRGYMTKIREGTIVTDREYASIGGLDHLKKAGLELEPMDD